MIKRVLAGASASAIALTMMISSTGVIKAAEPKESVTAYLTKDLVMSDLVATPASTFTFDFTQDTTATGVESDTVAIASKTITYTADEAGVVANDKRNVIKTVDVLDGVDFDHAGVYKYNVVENEATSSFTDTGAATGDQTMTYSAAEYNMYVYVANQEVGSGLYIEKVVVEQIKDDAGDDVTTDEKIDPSEPGDNGEGNGFRFTNTFNVKAGSEVDPTKPDPEDPDPTNPTLPEIPDEDFGNALRIAKTTVGKYANLNEEFDFTLTITKAPTDLGDGTYEATLVKASGNETITLTAGTAATFKLANGEKLVVSKDEMVVGTKFAVVENGVADYTATASVASNGVVSSVSGTKGDGLTISDTKVGALNNHAEVTNTHDDTATPPTGIIMNNLPAILLVGLTLAAAAGYIVSRKRKEI